MSLRGFFVLVAITNSQDQWAARACELVPRLRQTEIVTTAEVLVEVLTHFSPSGSYLRTKVVSVIRAIEAGPGFTVVP